MLAVDRRYERGEAATALLRRARGRFCLLLNEDSELEPGATVALHAALSQAAGRRCGGATLVKVDGTQQPSAWRFPGPAATVLSLLGLKRRLVVQSHGPRVRGVDWAPATALLVRRDAAEAVDWLDAGDVEFCRRLHQKGWRVLYVPEARAVHHEQ